MPHSRKNRVTTRQVERLPAKTCCDTISTKKGGDFVCEYQKLPLLPTEGRLHISEIRSFGLRGYVRDGHVINEPLVQFKEFTQASCEEYPLIESENSYAANEYVTPAAICCTDNTVYRTPMLYWFPLSDLCLAQELREISADPARYPFWARYDGYTDLMKKLFNRVGAAYIEKVPIQLCLYRVDGKDIDELGKEYDCFQAELSRNSHE